MHADMCTPSNTCVGTGICFDMQGRPIVICNKGDEETQQFAYNYLAVPHTVDCLQGILAVIPMQLLSFHIAVLRGYDVSFFIVA